MRHPELVGADLDPPSLVFGITPSPQGAFGLRRHGCQDARPSPQGAFGLGLVLRKDVMLRLYHAFLGLRNRPQPLTGKGCLLHKQKNPHRTADGTLRVRITTAGGSSPHCRASRGRMCGVHGHLARRSNPPPNYFRCLRSGGEGCDRNGTAWFSGVRRVRAEPARPLRVMLHSPGCGVGSNTFDPYGSYARCTRVNHAL